MSKEVYAVIRIWDSEASSPDFFWNCSENYVDGIFSTKIAAAKYVYEQLRDGLGEKCPTVEDIMSKIDSYDLSEYKIYDRCRAAEYFEINTFELRE